MRRLQELYHPLRCWSTASAARGFARQRSQRVLEHHLREHLVDFRAWTAQLGWSATQTAALLEIAPRTLRHWQHTLRAGTTLQPLGRPVQRAPRPERQAVLDLLHEVGPGLGLPTLRDCFPELARAELEDLLRRYRRVCRLRYHATWHVLHWTVPGSVWAMDFAQAPTPIDGLYPYLLAVRDLASGQQLLWLPTRAVSAQETTLALAMLFALHGAPLVLKSDNGSPFIADATRAFLRSAGVNSLFSPPQTPRYNGSIEAGIGSLKTRTERHAARSGHPAIWTSDDVAAAVDEANTLARPHGESSPTAQECWTARRRLTAAERALFTETLARLLDEERALEGLATEGSPSTTRERRAERNATRRALVEHGFLLFSRRRIPLPLRKKKVARIS
jgi:transposase InsO family protein